MKWLWLALLCLISVLGWVRFAPSDSTRWHDMPADVTDRDLGNGAMRVIEGDGETFARLDEVIRATPRTRVLAGSTEAGMITYVTRSAVFGFPDYTTIHQRSSRVEIFGRARFGLSDLGVNAGRIDGWLGALAQRGG